MLVYLFLSHLKKTFAYCFFDPENTNSIKKEVRFFFFSEPLHNAAQSAEAVE